MRLFIAIEFEKRIIDSLKQVQSDLKKAGLRGRYTREENFHLTLAFIGEYGEPEKVLKAMSEVPIGECSIDIEGLGRFGNLYWIGLKDNPYLIAYVKKLRDSLDRYGIPYDKKKFSPHITLVRDGISESRAGRMPDTFPKMKMKVSSVALVKSEYTAKGMKYTVIGCNQK